MSTKKQTDRDDSKYQKQNQQGISNIMRNNMGTILVLVFVVAIVSSELASKFQSQSTQPSSLVVYDYLQNGADWPAKFPDCQLPNQSPIDLPTNLKKSPIDAREDNFNRIYSNQKSEIPVTWNGYTSIVSITKPGQDVQAFQSKVAKSVYGASELFVGLQFHFHAGSEHTVDGERFDLEMHTVHQAKSTDGGVHYAALGIIFSVDKANVKLTDAQQNTINLFFDNLEWDTTNGNPKVEKVTYGDLMYLVDMNNRWVYKGTVTNPPCARLVYWNVLRNIYPIRQSDVEKFRKQLARHPGLEKTGNYRVTTPVDEHNIQVISSKI